MPPTQHHEEAVFRAAIQLVEGPVREAFLGMACVGDAQLRQRVEALIAVQEKQNSLPGPGGTDQMASDQAKPVPPHGGVGSEIMAQDSNFHPVTEASKAVWPRSDSFRSPT